MSSLISLFADGNRLTGRIPPEFGNLANLAILGLQENGFSGALPASLVRIEGLEDLRFAGNAGLCAPGGPEFVGWTHGLERLDGPFCNEADVAALNALHEAAGGTDWTNSDGWLGDDAIGAWHGVSADSLGRVTEIDLAEPTDWPVSFLSNWETSGA